MNKELGYFENPQGYSLVKVRDQRYMLVFWKAVYEFTLNPEHPLTFHHPDGRCIQPDRHLAETDLGSTPLSCQLFFPKDRLLLTYLNHDSGYKHGGLYVAEPGSTDFVFKRMSRKELDRLMVVMAAAEGAGRFGKSVIYIVVRIGGRWSYTEVPAHGRLPANILEHRR